MHWGRIDHDLMIKLRKEKSFLSREIRKNFSSFYLFGDNSLVKKDLVGKNDLTYGAGSPAVFYGKNGKGENSGASSYLVNRAITPTVTGFPLFIYVDVQDMDDPANPNYTMSLSPWITNNTREITIGMEGGSTNTVKGLLTDGGFLSESNPSKALPLRTYTAALVARSYTDFTLFVNGEKITPASTLASGFTTKNSIVICGKSNGGDGVVGGIFSAGWGTIDPGDDFLRRLSANPNQVIFQQMFQPRTATVTASSAKFRRSFTGTRSGSRQPIP